MNPPENISGLVHHLNKIRDNKRKAIHLLLEEIQKDINQQEKFVQEQNLRLKETEATLNSLKDCHVVFKTAQSMIPHLNNQVSKDIEAGGRGE